MANQQYKNHVRYYPPHHFVFYPIALGLLFICIKKYLSHQSDDALWLMMAALTAMLIFLSFMLRQHYALTNQNRTVRLEMRLRYYQLAQKPFDLIEHKLSFKQIAALRFAGNEELLPLINRTMTENLPPKMIKQLITNWQPDHMRV
ncbi:MAG: DUF6526 family protein [Chitinophagaceae bacterium]